MIYGLMIAFVPLFLGYLIRIRNQKILSWNNRIITCCLYFILLTMGISLGQLDDLTEKLAEIWGVALGMSLIIHICNIVFIIWIDKYYPRKEVKRVTTNLSSRWRLLLDALSLCLTVLVGGIIGYYLKKVFIFPLHTSTYILVIMIFCVGIQLRHSGIPIKAVFLNKWGIIVALLFILSSLVGGAVAAYFLDIPLSRALALACGFGWYSLSSVLLSDAWGAMYGSIAFFNDLSREIFCLFFYTFFYAKISCNSG